MRASDSTNRGDWRRREWLRTGAGLAGAMGGLASLPANATGEPAQSSQASRRGWTPEWDKALLDAAVAKERAEFDTVEHMLRRKVGPEYRYHTALRSQTVHPTRESLHYALLLLEQGGAENEPVALAVIERLLALQEKDPASRWYGLWGWYLEEPAPQMQPADWNWADFLGSLLLLIRHRHGERLGGTLRGRVDEAIRHAAYSVMRRNVRMGYTNIAIKGTFVTLASAELLGDANLRTYARERLRRFSAEVDLTGSFNEYNSPTYNRVGIENFTRMRMVWRDGDAIAQAARLEDRMWDHFSRRWHLGTRQLAGPMSRCYSTDIGRPLWLQKALGNMLEFAALDEIRTGAVASDAEASYLDFRCPEPFLERFRESGKTRVVREIFLASEAKGQPTQGTTWLTESAALGSINQGDWWVQRRPVLGWFRDGSGKAVSLQMRVMKDDYDFSSARIYSVQHENRVLGLINFQTPGGDKHISLDPIPEGGFPARSLRIQVDLAGGEFRLERESSVGIQGARKESSEAAWVAQIGEHRVRIRTVVCGDLRQESASPYVSRQRTNEQSIHIPWFGSESWEASGSRLVDWKKVSAVYAAFLLEVLPGGVVGGKRKSTGTIVLRENPDAGTVTVAEMGDGNVLSLTAGITVTAAETQNARFDGGKVGGIAVPLERLSEKRLADLFQP